MATNNSPWKERRRQLLAAEKQLIEVRAELHLYAVALRDVCMEHRETCSCKGCELAFRRETP